MGAKKFLALGDLFSLVYLIVLLGEVDARVRHLLVCPFDAETELER